MLIFQEEPVIFTEFVALRDIVTSEQDVMNLLDQYTTLTNPQINDVMNSYVDIALVRTEQLLKHKADLLLGLADLFNFYSIFAVRRHAPIRRKYCGNAV